MCLVFVWTDVSRSTSISQFSIRMCMLFISFYFVWFRCEKYIHTHTHTLDTSSHPFIHERWIRGGYIDDGVRGGFVVSYMISFDFVSLGKIKIFR